MYILNRIPIFSPLITRYVFPSVDGLRDGSSETNVANFLDKSFWSEIQNSLSSTHVKIIFLSGNYDLVHVESGLSRSNIGYPVYGLTLRGSCDTQFRASGDLRQDDVYGQVYGAFIDSTPPSPLPHKREKQHRAFKGIAEKGQYSIGWFYGFKLYLIINYKGEILDFILTPGNVDDRESLKNMDLHKRILGKLFGDKGYISKYLFEQLFVDGVHLVTKLRKNMKNALMLLKDHIMLRKRALIESVNDELKNMCQIEHTRHRCFDNFIINTLSALSAYFSFGK